MDNLRQHDLEAPYQAMVAASARYESANDRVFDELVDELADNQTACSKLLWNHCDDPHEEAAKLMAEIASCWNAEPEVFIRRLKFQFCQIVESYVEKKAETEQFDAPYNPFEGE